MREGDGDDPEQRDRGRFGRDVDARVAADDTFALPARKRLCEIKNRTLFNA